MPSVVCGVPTSRAAPNYALFDSGSTLSGRRLPPTIWHTPRMDMARCGRDGPSGEGEIHGNGPRPRRQRAPNCPTVRDDTAEVRGVTAGPAAAAIVTVGGPQGQAPSGSIDRALKAAGRQQIELEHNTHPHTHIEHFSNRDRGKLYRHRL